MGLIDVFYAPEYIDCYTFVFDDIDPHSGLYTMLGTSETGTGFSQWTEGKYEPNGDNSHLGAQRHFTPEDIGEALVKHVIWRMDDTYETA